MASQAQYQNIEKLNFNGKLNGSFSSDMPYDFMPNFLTVTKRKLCNDDALEDSVQVKEELSSNDIFIQILEKSIVHAELEFKTNKNQEIEFGYMADRYASGGYFANRPLRQKEKHRTNIFNKVPTNFLKDIFFDTKNSSDQNIESLRIKLQNSSVWLLLKFPNEPLDKAFQYIGAIATNNLHDGLLHSYVRNRNNWEKSIPQLLTLWNDFESKIQSQLNKIQSSRTKKTCGIEIENLLEILKKEASTDTIKAFIEAQLKVYEFIKSNTDKFLFEGVDHCRQIKIHFEIPNSDNDTHAMVLSVSSHLYTSKESKIERPIRKVTTAYFISKREFQRCNADYESDDDEEEEDDDDDEADADDFTEQQKRDAMERHSTLSSSQPDYREKLLYDLKEIPNEEIKKKVDTENDQRKDKSDSVENSADGNDSTPDSESYYLHVRMPSNFAYTCAILTNDFSKGLLHTFVRHWDHFQDYIDSFKNLRYVRLLVISKEIQDIHNAKSSKEKKKAYKMIDTAIKGQDDQKYNDIWSCLKEAQLDLLKYIQDNVTGGIYHGEGLYTLTLVQVYFETLDHGPESLKAVCVDCLFYPTTISNIELDSDAKYFKTINTVFYTTEHRRIYAGKSWPSIV